MVEKKKKKNEFQEGTSGSHVLTVTKRDICQIDVNIGLESSVELISNLDMLTKCVKVKVMAQHTQFGDSV